MGKKLCRGLLLLSAIAATASFADAATLGASFRLAANNATLARDDAPPLQLYIQANDSAALRLALSAQGLSFGTADNHVFWVRATLAQAFALAQHPATANIELAPHLHPLLDQSAHDIGVDLVHAGTGVRAARTGKGVLIGILDTGIDLHHPAFLGADGQSRVIAAWDQDAPGVGPPGYGYGHVCSRSDILGGTCSVTDTEGHGTHVAGILAGAMAPHIGMAPEAELVVVKSSQFTDVAGAVDWMFHVADSEGKSIVVNLSLGGHLGAHDGQSDLEAALAKMQSAGHIIVTAAGNDGENTLHLHDSLATGTHRGEVALPSPGLLVQTTLEMWQQPGPGTLTYFLEVTDAHGSPLASAALSDSGAGQTGALADRWGVVRGRFSYAEDAANAQGKTHRAIVIDRVGQGNDMDGDRWFLAWTGGGTFDAWSTTDDESQGNATFITPADPAIAGMVAGDTQATITIPGTAHDLITVGSFVTKNAWSSKSGQSYEIADASLLAVSSFSSQGPTADPSVTGPKPDLLAPGQLIAAPLSSEVLGFSSVLAIDDNFAVMQGTSMSAPHVAGTVALMLELDPGLSPADAKTMLMQTAQPLGDVNQAGAGRIAAQAAVQKLEGTTGDKHGCAAATPDAAMLTILVMCASAMRRRRLQRHLQRHLQRS
jgi:subtilisin family serine protease